MNKKELTLKQFIAVFLTNKRLLITVSLIAGIVTAYFMWFVIDPIFLSTATVKTTTKAGGLAGLLGEGMPGLGDFEDLAGGGGQTGKELALYETILYSRRCVEEAIIRFKLNDEWNHKYMQDAVKHFREEVMYVLKDKLAGTMEIGAFDENPERAKEITEFLISQLNDINVEVNVLNARNNREFIEKRYLLARNDLTGTEDSLRQFQDIFGVAPDIQVQAAVKTELELEAEVKSEEVKLEILRKILSPNEAEIKTQEEKIASLQRHLSEIQTSSVRDSKLNLQGGPEVVMNYLRLRREVEIQNKIVATLIPLYEQARIEENKEMPSVLVIDKPFIPERKEKPKRMVTTLTVIFFVCFGTYLILLIRTILAERYGIGRSKAIELE